MGKIYWTKADGMLNTEIEPPFPSYNALQDKIYYNSACYVNLSARDKALELYDKSTVELLEMIHKKYAEVKELQDKNKSQELLINNLNEQLQTFKKEQGKGKRISKELLKQKGQIFEWKEIGISNREIARRLGVSEGTIRNFLRNKNKI